MLATQRKKTILDWLARDGQVLAGPMALDLGVSEDTIRRDLRELAAEGLLQRVHVGACLPRQPSRHLQKDERWSHPANARSESLPHP
jgi:DeoR/GlpR family transcriptional regulator of sugar metabolism